MARPEDSDNVKSFMSNSENRKLYLQTCDRAKKFRQQQSKVKFLQDCLKFKIPPVTCTVRYRQPLQQHSQTQQQCEDIRKKASLDLLRIQIRNEEVEMGRRKEVFQTSLENLSTRCLEAWSEVKPGLFNKFSTSSTNPLSIIFKNLSLTIFLCSSLSPGSIEN